MLTFPDHMKYQNLPFGVSQEKTGSTLSTLREWQPQDQLGAKKKLFINQHFVDMLTAQSAPKLVTYKYVVDVEVTHLCQMLLLCPVFLSRYT